MRSKPPAQGIRSARASLLALLVLSALAAPPTSLAQAGTSALPAHYRVPIAQASEERVTLAPSTAYGYTESVLPGRDVHHRLSGGVAGAYVSDIGLAAEARFDARYDRHEVRRESDSGAVLDPRLALRYTRPAFDRAFVMGQLGVWLPGEKAPAPSFPATTIDALLALSFLASARVQLTGSGGYRFDRSAKSIDHPERLSGGDWLALGVSDFDAVLAGAAMRAKVGASALFAEVRWDVLVGAGAPGASESPLHAALGASTPIFGDHTTAVLVADVLASARPSAGPGQALTPFDPRFSVVFGISHDFVWGQAHVEAAQPSTEPKPVVVQKPEPAPAEPEPALPQGALRVMVRDAVRGEPLLADVEVASPEGEGEQAPRKGQTVEGALELEVPPGKYEVEISAPGYVRQRRRVSVDEQGVTVLNIDLRPKGGR